MNNEQMQPLLEVWLRDRNEAARDAKGDITRVMARVPQTRQRGRWWPLPAFDRPVSAIPSRELAPAPIPATNGRQPVRGFTMFSALKFVAAAAIVALFGGFLLAGVFTTQQGDEMTPATVTDEVLPGVTLSVEEVEPGVYRVVDDGVRGLTSIEAVDIVAGYDGGIWLTQDDEFLRLGGDGSHAWPDVPFADQDASRVDHILEVAPDGTMWVIPRWASNWHLDPRRAPGLRSSDGEAWTVEPCPGGRQYPECRGFTVAPDGRVWVTWHEEDGAWRLGHLGPTGWQPLDGELPTHFKCLFFTDAGGFYGMRDGEDRLYRYVEGGSFIHEEGWNAPTPPTSWEYVAGSVFGPYVLGVGRDGTVWLDDDGALARLADGEWEHVTSTDLLDPGFGLGHEFQVAPDGSLWSGLWREGADSTDPQPCDGLVRFDGQTLDHFLPGRCTAMDIAPDGSAWVLAADEVVLGTSRFFLDRRWALRDGQTWDLYVITPEAVAAE